MKKNEQLIIYINDITLNQFVNYIHSAIFTEGRKFKNIKKIKKI